MYCFKHVNFSYVAEIIVLQKKRKKNEKKENNQTKTTKNFKKRKKKGLESLLHKNSNCSFNYFNKKLKQKTSILAEIRAQISVAAFYYTVWTHYTHTF